MILSIGMIVKNEEKFLFRCLSCLKPILEQVDSELIIADTGSTDSSLEIAKQFTDNVFQIEWRGDFAWARNQTLDRAKGEWFMFVDADEFMQDVTELIDFFNSGDYKRYNTARHLREEVSEKFTMNTISMVSRLFKIGRNTRFVGKIHEGVPEVPPYKNLNGVISLHEGYNYNVDDGDKLREAKHERNMLPLLELYEEDPRDKRTLAHIINEYVVNNKLDKAREFVEKALDLYKGGKPLDPPYHFFRLRKIGCYVLKERDEEVVEDIREYFKTADKLYVTAIDMRVFEAQALDRMERFEEMLVALSNALDLCEKNQKGQLDDYILGLTSSIGISPGIKEVLTREMARTYARLGDFENARLWAVKTGDKGFDIYEPYVEVLRKQKRLSDVAKLYNYLTINFEPDSTDFTRGVAAIERHMADPASKREVASAIIGAAGEKDKENDYVRLQRIRSLYSEGGVDLDAEIDYFNTAGKSFSQHYGDVIAAALKRGIDFTPFTDKMEISDTVALISGVTRTNDGLSRIIPDFLKKSGWLDTNRSVKSARILYLLAYGLIKYNLLSDDNEKMDVFESYVRTAHAFFSMVYKDDVWNDNAVDALLEQDRFVYYAGKAYCCKDGGDTLGLVKNLRTALKLDASMKDIISLITDKLRQDEESARQKAADARVRLDTETAAIKSVLYALIKSNNLEKAEQVLNSYAQINPSDPDIASIRRMIDNPN